MNKLTDELLDLINQNKIHKACELIQNELNVLNWEEINSFLYDIFCDVGINDSKIMISHNVTDNSYVIEGYEGNGDFVVDEEDYEDRHRHYTVTFEDMWVNTSYEDRIKYGNKISEKISKNTEEFSQRLKILIDEYYGKLSGNEIKDIFNLIHKSKYNG